MTPRSMQGFIGESRLTTILHKALMIQEHNLNFELSSKLPILNLSSRLAHVLEQAHD